MKYSVFVTLMLLTPSLAGPPFVTDDPEPVEYGHYEFYLASEQTRTKEGSSGTLPHVEINYGALPDLQLHAIVPYVFNNPTGAPHQRGMGDLEFGAKYRFVDETKERPMVGIFPLIEINTGNAAKGLGNGRPQVFLPVWLQKKWGEWQSYGGGGYRINRAINKKNNWFAGWQLQKDLSKKLTLGGEVFCNTEQTPGEGTSTGFNIGVIHNINKNKYFMFSVGRGLTNANNTNRFSAYIAFQLTW